MDPVKRWRHANFKTSRVGCGRFELLPFMRSGETHQIGHPPCRQYGLKELEKENTEQ